MHPQLLDPVLDPDSLLGKLDAIEQARKEHPEHAQVPDEIYAQVRQMLTAPALRQGSPSASTPRAPGDLSRPPATIYLHPHATLSQFQSVITYCFDAELVSAGELEPTHHGLRHWVDELVERFRRYGPCDIQWIEPAMTRLITSLTGDKYPFPDLRPATVPLAERAKVFIVGDWATGLPQARNVARAIKAQLDAVPDGLECHVIHLGDTYYSGLREEYADRFLPLWPIEEGSHARSWALNGNHDMYSGGHGFFEVLLRDPRFAAQGGSSYFCLGNRHWQIVGLDSSYKDPDVPDLAGSQVPWLEGLLAPQGRPGTILLTHHQPFSAWESVSSPLPGRVVGAIGDRQIEAWLWGHEHRCAVYEPKIQFGPYHDHAAYTAIVGHGGVPNLESGPAVTPPQDAVDVRCLSWQNTDDYTVAQDTWSLGGFAVLDLNGDEATIQYFTELGQTRTDRSGNEVPPDTIARVT